MSRWSAAAAAVFIVLCLGCGDGSSDDGSAAQLPEHDRMIVCRISADTVTGTVPPGLFGTNVEWFNNANGLWDPVRGLDRELVRLARQQGVSVIRFPGGTLSDFYHWQDGTGPRGRRPVRPHVTDPSSSGNPFGTPELYRFCRLIGAEPLLTVNAGTGTAREAADWVAYCNAPANRLRAADGFAAPLDVRLWEIGNEVYLAGNAVEKKITMPPEDYAETFLKFAQSMRSVDPDIALMAIGTARSTSIPFSEYRDWTATVLERAASEIDYVAVHNAYFPVLIGVKNARPRDVYRALWAAPEAVSRSFDELEGLIARWEQERTINIAVTEWGAVFSLTDPAWIDHVKTLGTAVYAARLMQIFLGHPRVRIANFFKYADNTFMGWIGGNRTPKVPYYVIEMFTRHFGTRLCPAQVTGSPLYGSRSFGLTAAEKDVPEITAVAALNDRKDTLFINIVNRSWDTAHEVHLQIDGFSVAERSAVGWLLSADSPLAHNGRDLEPWWPIAYREPDGEPLPPGPTKVTKTAVSLAAPVVVPPHSVIVVEIGRSK